MNSRNTTGATEMTPQTAAEQRKSLVARFEQMTGETVPAYAKNIDILAWIRDEIAAQARAVE